MASMQVTYNGKDGNKVCEMGGFRFVEGEMVDVTVNEANAALLAEIQKDKAFTSVPAPVPPEPEAPPPTKSDKPHLKADPKADTKKNQHEA
jgi:hypothetical protein